MKMMCVYMNMMKIFIIDTAVETIDRETMIG